ncbi:MAG: hypothetical protein RR878_12735 [Anaerorhabdus sp.]|uniref:HTH domain-containing protein n=1 Tax=Anaerorhabdus sp. TaxID=1872524 RepID=UPI002FC89BB0
MKKITKEQIERLEKSEHVASVNENQVVFTDEFKQLALQEWKSGVGPKQIFDKYDIGYAILGTCRVKNNLDRWKKQESRLEGFQRIKGSGRPKKPTFNSVEEENEYLKNQLEYQQQEIEFLKKLKALEVKYQRKKNTK